MNYASLQKYITKIQKFDKNKKSGTGDIPVSWIIGTVIDKWIENLTAPSCGCTLQPNCSVELIT